MNTGLDKDGYIIPEVSESSLMTEHTSTIDKAVIALTTELAGQLHSIYVYGSVARGNAVKGKSDLDLLVVFSNKPTEDQKAKVKQLAEELSTKIRPDLREVGIETTYYDEVTDSANLYGWGAYLAIFCLCVWGEDLVPTFPRFKLTPQIAFGFNGDIEEAVQRYSKQIGDESDTRKLLLVCSQMSRKLIRTSYSMVMSRTQISTSSLQRQASLLIKYFPSKQDDLELLIKWAAEPISDKQALFDMLQNYGSWLVTNFAAEANKTAIV